MSQWGQRILPLKPVRKPDASANSAPPRPRDWSLQRVGRSKRKSPELQTQYHRRIELWRSAGTEIGAGTASVGLFLDAKRCWLNEAQLEYLARWLADEPLDARGVAQSLFGIHRRTPSPAVSSIISTAAANLRGAPSSCRLLPLDISWSLYGIQCQSE
eukprot:Hpha_TRINITY_DN1004_c0_g1::TRINITY_DN1004_c0_g1_i1::g.84755::m.84755